MFRINFLFLLLFSCQLLMANTHLASTASAYNSYESDGESNNAKLILIGIVYERNTTKPASGIQIKVEDRYGKSPTLSARTTKDGTFYFKLESDKQYQVYTYGYANQVEDVKQISTIGKYTPEVFKTVMMVDKQAQQTAEFFRDPMEVKTAPAKAAKINSALTFKIQLGVFKDKLPTNSPFLKNANMPIVQEPANGFIRYMGGNYESLENAKVALEQLGQKGYTKIFVVPYYKEERLKMKPEEAIQNYGNK